MLAVASITASFTTSHAAETSPAPAHNAATLGERLLGEITSADELNGNDGSFYQRHHLALEAGSLVEFELGGALRGSLSLFGPSGQWLTATHDDPEEAPVRLRQRIGEDGDYLVVVSGRDARSFGPYFLDSRQLEMLDGGTITAPVELTGWLDGIDNRYQLQIEEAGLYIINMRSQDLDAFLELTGPEGFALSDDDSGHGLDARLTTLLDAGEYTLVARASHGYGQGVYSLDISAQAMPDDNDMHNGGPLALDTRVSGWFHGKEIDYQITLSERLEVVIDMQSADFDSYLTLVGDDIMLSDDDGGDGLDARIEALLEPGQYTIRAGSFGSGSGRFSLSTRTSAVTDEGGDNALQSMLRP